MKLREESNDVGALADLLEPSTPRPTARTPRTGDIAFADTIHVRDLDLGATGEELPPVSSPVIVNDPDQGTQWMTPFAFPLPPASQDVSFATKVRILSARVRHGLRGSIEEAHDAWSQASEARTPVDRIRALWSFWEWERSDLVRAAIMGGAVFLVVATLGAFAITGANDRSETSGVTASASVASETGVRAPRTVGQQHTGRAFYPSPTRRTRR